METIKIERDGEIAVVRLNRPKANAINLKMADELMEAFLLLKADNAVRGVLLTGQGEFFSAGLDVVELFGYDTPTMLEFWREFDRMVRTLVSFPKPLVCGISGHSPAGGCVLALACDYRVMAEGRYKVGLNEVPVGIVVPEPIFHLLAFWVGSGKAYQYLLEGRMFTAPEAMEAGLVDQICLLSEVEEAGKQKLQQYLRFNSKVWKQSKLNFRNTLLQRLGADFKAAFEPTLKHWWSDESRSQMEAMIKSLGKA